MISSSLVVQQLRIRYVTSVSWVTAVVWVESLAQELPHDSQEKERKGTTQIGRYVDC